MCMQKGMRKKKKLIKQVKVLKENISKIILIKVKMMIKVKLMCFFISK
jgi:2-methylaconitate cis-trans-isomerase PrpF